MLEPPLAELLLELERHYEVELVLTPGATPDGSLQRFVQRDVAYFERHGASYDRVRGAFDRLRETLVDLFPGVKDSAITQRWGGALGITRDWTASVAGGTLRA